METNCIQSSWAGGCTGAYSGSGSGSAPDTAIGEFTFVATKPALSGTIRYYVSINSKYGSGYAKLWVWNYNTSQYDILFNESYAGVNKQYAYNIGDVITGACSITALGQCCYVSSQVSYECGYLAYPIDSKYISPTDNKTVKLKGEFFTDGNPNSSTELNGLYIDFNECIGSTHEVIEHCLNNSEKKWKDCVSGQWVENSTPCKHLTCIDGFCNEVIGDVQDAAGCINIGDVCQDGVTPPVTKAFDWKIIAGVVAVGALIGTAVWLNKKY